MQVSGFSPEIFNGLMQLLATDVPLSLAEGVTQSALQVDGTPVSADTLNPSNLLGQQQMARS